MNEEVRADAHAHADAAPQGGASARRARGAGKVRSTLEVRAFPGGFDADIPRWWLGGSALATHLANGVNLLFPPGERFFIRSVRHYLDRIADDPALVADVHAFFGQEGRHAQAHDRVMKMLEEQGYDVATFMRVYEAICYGFIEKVAPPKLRLSTTVAIEHFTAIMAENALRDGVLDLAHPRLKALLSWHAAEEIEHRAVAFRVLQRVDPSYPLRVTGLAVATTLLAGFWIAGTAMLLAQDREGLRRVKREAPELGERNPFGKRVFGKGIAKYLRRDFDPAAPSDLDELASRYLAAAGLSPSA